MGNKRAKPRLFLICSMTTNRESMAHRTLDYHSSSTDSYRTHGSSTATRGVNVDLSGTQTPALCSLSGCALS